MSPYDERPTAMGTDHCARTRGRLAGLQLGEAKVHEAPLAFGGCELQCALVGGPRLLGAAEAGKQLTPRGV